MITREPKPGDTIAYEHDNNGPIDRWTVHHCTGSLCYSQADEKNDTKVFIWRFADGVHNSIHTIEND
jgi:hypothetical protein